MFSTTGLRSENSISGDSRNTERPLQRLGGGSVKESNIVADLQSRLLDLSEVLRRAEERATPGLLALELMHEIRNPLEAVGNLAYLAMEEADDGEAVRVYLRRIEEQLATLNHIASQTLGFARTTNSPQQVRLATLAEAALRIHQNTMKAKQIRVVKDLPQEVTSMYTPRKCCR